MSPQQQKEHLEMRQEQRKNDEIVRSLSPEEA
jgi:hypothetical protein